MGLPDLDLSFLFCPFVSSAVRNFKKGTLEKGYLHKIVRNLLAIRNKFATILRTLPLMHEAKYRQFCANLARNLRQICATPLSRTPPSRDF